MSELTSGATGPPPWLRQGQLIGGGQRPSYLLGPLLHEAESAWLQEVVDEFGRALVLKLLRPQPSQGEVAEAKWQRELRLLSRVHHPGVVRLHDAFPIDDHFALVLERADLSLSAWIERHGPMAEAEVRVLAWQLLEALSAIHRAGVIHLDLAPSNVLLRTGDPTRLQVLIADFGIGICLEEQETLGRPSTDWALLPPELLGPGFHSPTPRCDLYALGHTLLYALRGSLPFSNVLGHEEVERHILQGTFQRQAFELGTPLGMVLARLLAVDPESRYSSALETWRDLQQLP